MLSEWRTKFEDKMSLASIVLLCLAVPSVVPAVTTDLGQNDSMCIMPSPPANGVYFFTGTPNADTIQLSTICDNGYMAEYDGPVYCSRGRWTRELPKCISSCRLNGHQTVYYNCEVGEYTRFCNEEEASTTVVNLECVNTGELLPPMNCVNGSWDSFPTCKPDCGRVTPHADQEQGQEDSWFKWHIHVYDRTGNFTRICGGSLIYSNLMVTAAHCFWDEQNKTLLPRNMFEVAIGKRYPEWNDPRDTHAQTSNISNIRIPDSYKGNSSSYSYDMAIVTLTNHFEYNDYVGKVCVDDNLYIEANQLREGKTGKVVGWAAPEIKGNQSQPLKIVNVDYTRTDQCKQQSPAEFERYLTLDKFCVGYQNRSALCKADSGSGVVFPESDRGSPRYYLRGVVSTAPSSDDSECDAFPFVTFVRIIKHKKFKKDVLYYLADGAI